MKRQAILLLCGVMAFSAGACASGADESEISQINIGAPDYSGATGKIVLDSWIGPLMSEEAYKEYADCGYDRVHFQNTSVHVEGGAGEQSFKTLNEQLDTHFTLAEKNGIDVILAMNARNMNATSATPFEWSGDVCVRTPFALFTASFVSSMVSFSMSLPPRRLKKTTVSSSETNT